MITKSYRKIIKVYCNLQSIQYYTTKYEVVFSSITSFMKNFKENQKVIVRNDIAIWTIVDDTNIVWWEMQQNLAWQEVTILQVIDNPTPIYIIKEDESWWWWAHGFFVGPANQTATDSDKEDTKQPKWNNRRIRKTVQKESIDPNDPFAEPEFVTVIVDPICETVEGLKKWKDKFDQKVKDNDTLWDLFFSKLEDTLRIKFDN